MPSEQEINDIVARVSAQVLREVKSSEQVFRIGDLSTHVIDLGKGGDAAWTISYSTAAATLDGGTRIRTLDEVAWTISYSTSKPTLTERGIEQKN
ncbi:hypothetical protein C8J44_0346 [Sphingomonas sp. PP-CE-3A-406]|uniref:hypothetical protein n=1 Tax=unclassified Sphingomonas TaxID=196159 RepID=UPI000714B5CD|nr:MULTISPECIES: hypothetical protein [unclassified Sphingomonas]KQO09204.1 hypothetical protein ASF09_06010 [Sphingomonas sp. Leaf242]RMB55112.1 hypothetical protein C8J44_0346 [Sphingomonas sp. PP-CE-3A-406]